MQATSTHIRSDHARWFRCSAALSVVAVQLCCIDPVHAETRTVTVVYRGTQPAEPGSIAFQVGDRLALTAREADLGRQLVSRSVRVDGMIHYYQRTEVEQRKTPCWLGLRTCTEEIHRKIYGSQPVANATQTQYSPFLQVGPALQFVTAAGTKDFLLQGQDSHARDVLASGGYVYVAMHEGTIALGQLVLPTSSFGAGSESATPDESSWGHKWVHDQCTGKLECTVVGEPQISVTRGSVELQIVVEIDHP